MAKTKSTQVLQKNQIAPNFTLTGIDEKRYSLTSFSSSKLLLVVFVCNHCPYVKARIGDIVDLQSKFDKSDLQIVAINSNDPDYQDEGFENMKKFGSERKLVFHGKINDALEPDMTPKVQTMEENVHKVLAGQELEKEFDPSIGCSIKWKN
jgi:thiol-disulfide isomerase/thioredoxin